jgi:imidazolonepropionase-like amidohydrolase
VIHTSRKSKIFFLIFCISLFSLLSCRPHNASTIAITHVTVIDPANSIIHPDFTVIVTQSRIYAVGPSVSTAIPPDTKIVDAAGKFMIPGLVDMHLHLLGAGEPFGSRKFILPLLIANGITTVRDMGGDVQQLKQLCKEIDAGKRIGPQIFFTGPYLDGDPPSFQPSIVVRYEAEANDVVKQLKSEGVDFIKVQSRLQPEGYFAIARASHANGMRYVGHVPDSVSASAASDAGQASIEHLTGVLLGCSSEEDQLRKRQFAVFEGSNSAIQSRQRALDWQRDLLESYSPEKARQLFQKFAANHTAQTPTLPLLVHLAFLTPATDLVNDPRMKYIPSNVHKIWEASRRANLLDQSEEQFKLRKELTLRSLALLKNMHDAGVTIMAGTDTTAPNVFPGFSLHEDLFYQVQAGLTPLQALQSATCVPATFLGRESQQGSIAIAQRADLLLLEANPIEDIRNTQKIWALVLDGKFLDRDKLNELLEGAERFASAH